MLAIITVHYWLNPGLPETRGIVTIQETIGQLRQPIVAIETLYNIETLYHFKTFYHFKTLYQQLNKKTISEN